MVLVAFAALLSSLSASVQDRMDDGRHIRVGWNDEFNRVNGWTPLNVENKPIVPRQKRGSIQLVLTPRPKDWPYEYQWSGVTREVKQDVARFPVLVARVRDVHGYAHLDIDVLDAEGKVVKGFRASTLTTDGLTTIDLGASLDPATYSLRVRLIVGGPNAGCDVTYDWIRAVSRKDAEFLTAHPDYQNVLPDRLWGSLR